MLALFVSLLCRRRLVAIDQLHEQGNLDRYRSGCGSHYICLQAAQEKEKSSYLITYLVPWARKTAREIVALQADRGVDEYRSVADDRAKRLIASGSCTVPKNARA